MANGASHNILERFLLFQIKNFKYISAFIIIFSLIMFFVFISTKF